MPKMFARVKFIGKFVKFLEKMLRDGMVRRWFRMFSDGRTNVHDDDRSGRPSCPSLVTADLLHQVNEKIREIRRFAMSELITHYLHISRSLMHKIVMEHLKYHKLCARWVPKTKQSALRQH
jgi:hypothetical protein